MIEITNVSPNSLAARTGLQTGDIIWNYDKWLFFDGSKTLYANWDDAAKALIADVKSPGDTMRQLVAIRRGKPIGFRTVPGTLGIELTAILVTRNWLTGAGQKTLLSPP